MDIHYNAFISYRHHPDDIRVATEIHRSLERFKVPRALRKKTGTITRIFRDKEELPITSSLTDDIYRAIENSDFLIVICSVHTKESIWVQREIETFLKTHDHSQVLTVLASGEPYDVIPEILLHKEVVDPDTGEVRIEDIEPLSCDWRLKRRQAMREELPRLAAALLHCGYDELRQRQRQYRMRRLVAGISTALAASVCLTAYFLYTSIQIQKANEELAAANDRISRANVEIRSNLEQALRNQSQYLASSAITRMEEGDRLTAIALALEALPGSGNDRPYVASAELALSKAMGSYVATERVQAIGAYTADAMVEDFYVTEDGSRIFILDSINTITVWDTEQFRKIGTIFPGEEHIDEIFTTKDNRILLLSRSILRCYDDSGILCWEAESGRDMARLADESVLMVLQNGFSEGSVLFLDMETGKQLRRYDLQVTEGAFLQSFGQNVYEAYWPITLICDENTENAVYLLYPDTGEFTRLMGAAVESGTLKGEFDSVSITENGNILVLVDDGSGFYNGTYQNIQITSPSRSEIRCYQPESKKLLWTSEITSSIYSGDYCVQSIPGSGNILCQSGNSFQIHEEATGKCIARCDLPSIPLQVIVGEDSATGILKEGASYIYNYGDNSCYTTSFMDGNAVAAQLNRGGYILEELSFQVTRYRSEKDDSGEAVEGEYDTYAENRVASGRYLAVKSYDRLMLVDLEKKVLLWNLERTFQDKLLGFSGDGETLWLWNGAEEYLECLGASGERISTLQIPVRIGEQYTCHSDMCLEQDQLYYALGTADQLQLCRVNLQTGEASLYSIGDRIPEISADYSKYVTVLGADDRNVWFWHSDGAVYVYDMTADQLQRIRSEVLFQPAFATDGKRIALGAEHEILLLDEQGRTACSILLDSRKAVSLHFHGDVLLALCDDGEVYRYSEAGELLGNTVLEIYNTFFSNIHSQRSLPSAITWQETRDGDLLLSAFTAGNLIDTETWQIRAFVPYLIAYRQDSNQLFARADGKLIAYPCYSTAQQMQRAEEILNGFELTRDQKAYYGIEDTAGKQNPAEGK